MKKVLTIAGSDCSGGAGIQADIKTITVHKMYAMSVITALTAQNTVEVASVAAAEPEFIAAQLDCVFRDIRPDAVKTGMLADGACIKTAADKLAEYGAENIVLDPVMVSTSGHALMDEDAAETLIKCLFPMAAVITPNIPEAEAISGIVIRSEEDMLRAAERLGSFTDAAVLIKGGHSRGAADDLLLCNGKAQWLRSERINNPNTHGTGCTLSSAIACGLADGLSVVQSVKQAKNYVTGAIRAGLDIGSGNGPLNHMYNIS